MSDNGQITVQKWLELYPEPVATATRTSHEVIFQLLKNTPDEVAILDLRNDRYPGYLKESINITATSLTGSEHVKAELIDPIRKFKPNMKLIVVHCNSSKNRATKIAGWIQDYINSGTEVGHFEVTVLINGISGWLELPAPYSSYINALPQ